MPISILITVPSQIRTLNTKLTRHRVPTTRALRSPASIPHATLYLHQRSLLNNVNAFLRIMTVRHVSCQGVFVAMFTVPDAHTAVRCGVVMGIAFFAETRDAVAAASFDGGLTRIAELRFKVYVVEFVVRGFGGRAKHEEGGDHGAYDVVAGVVKVWFFDVVLGKQVWETNLAGWVDEAVFYGEDLCVDCCGDGAEFFKVKAKARFYDFIVV